MQVYSNEKWRIESTAVRVPLDDCPFCIEEDAAFKTSILWNEHAYARYDMFPVTNLHALIIPFRHAQSFFSVTSEEMLAVDQLMSMMMNHIMKEDPQVEGFNIGWNHGHAAGQTIYHAHMHIIPRRSGDVQNPRGGIRNVIPGKGDY